MGLFNTIRRAIAWLAGLFAVAQKPLPVVSMWANTYPGIWTHDGVSVYYGGECVVESWRRASELKLDELCARMNATTNIPRRILWALRRTADGVEVACPLRSPVLYQGAWGPIHDIVPDEVRKQAEEMMK